MTQPLHRGRRLRRTPALRRLVAETVVRPSDLIAPLFVRDGIDAPVPISSMPGQFQHSIDALKKEVARLLSVGVEGIILFGVPDPKDKDAKGSPAWDKEGIAQRALRALRDEFADETVLMADLCLDEYTDHGHCGVLDKRGVVDNDATVSLYCEVALAQARAGAQIVAPSGMMDGQVKAIRHALDTSGFSEVAIMAYSAKYASTLFGPFRDAVEVTIANGGDRRSYQQDPANRKESLREIRADIEEGADIVMVKPAITSLDILADAAREVTVPLAAYQVSGEYAMIHAAAQRGWITGPGVALEHATAIKRAGADLLLTYFAADIATELNR
jgi:porphobilinogen synthase